MYHNFGGAKIHSNLFRHRGAFTQLWICTFSAFDHLHGKGTFELLEGKGAFTSLDGTVLFLPLEFSYLFSFLMQVYLH